MRVSFWMKWVPWAAKALAHPSLLPIALATFVSVAGPGGVAEFGRNMPPGSIVAVAPENAVVLANEPPPVPLVRVVHEQTPAPVGPIINSEAPPVEIEEAITPSNEVTGTDEALVASEDYTHTIPTAEPVEPPPDSGEPPAGANTREQPADDPADNGAGGGDGNTGGEVDQPVDNDPPSSPPNDGGSGEEPSDGDSGEQPSDRGSEGDATGDPGEGTCDVPGNGHEKHDVEPGHDKNNDGIDDRCQQTEGDNGSPVEGECDVPGNGHDEHPVEPGHDKDGDGVDDRCQTDGGNDSDLSDGTCDEEPSNGDGHEADPGDCHENDGGGRNGSVGGGSEGNNGRKDEG